MQCETRNDESARVSHVIPLLVRALNDSLTLRQDWPRYVLFPSRIRFPRARARVRYY